jgi:hypothetical protein
MGFLDTIIGVGAAFATGGASLYWQAAAFIYSFSKGGPEQFGARVGDRNVALDGEGQVKSRTWGRDRIELKMVYTSGLIEDEKSKKKGGLFGIGGTKVTTFTYAHNGVYLAGRGPITQPHRLKLNQYVPWDWNGGAQQGGTLTFNGQFWEGETRLKSDKKATKIRIYPGTLDQPVDPLLVAAKGPNQWTNYPGDVVVAIEVPDVVKYGQQAPRGSLEHENNQTEVSDVILEVASWVGLGPGDFDLSAVEGITVAPTPGEGFTVSSRRSASSIIEELMDTYDFSLPEKDGVFVAVLNDQPRAATLLARDQRIHTFGEGTPDTGLIEEDEDSLPEIMEATFGDVGREGATGYRCARRQQLEFTGGADNGTSKKENFTLSGSYRGARVARVCQVRLGKRWAGARKIALSWGLKHLYLASGDRVGVESPLGDGEVFDVQLPKLDIPLFGATRCIAPLHDPLLFGLELGPETGDIDRKTPVEPGAPIVFAGECPVVDADNFPFSQKCYIVAVCRSVFDTSWEGAVINVDVLPPGGTWKEVDEGEYENEAIIGELTTAWTPELPSSGATGDFSAQVWGGAIFPSTAPLGNLALFDGGLLAVLGSAAHTGSGGDSRLYSVSGVQSGVLGSDDFVLGEPLPAGTRFVMLTDAAGDFEDGPLWKRAPKLTQLGTQVRLRINEQNGDGEQVTWDMGEPSGQNVRTPSPVVTVSRESGLSLAGYGRTRIIDNMALDGQPDQGGPYLEKAFSLGYKFQITLNCAGASADLIRYTTDDQAAFDFNWSAAELSILLNRTEEQIAADEITGTIAQYGEISLGRPAQFVVLAPVPTLALESGGKILLEDGSHLSLE